MLQRNRLITGMLLLLTTLLGSGLVSGLESSFERVAQPIKRQHARLNSGILSDKAENEKAVQQFEVLRNSLLMFWMCGGVFPGSLVGVLIRQLAGRQALVNFLVSICTAIPVTPYCLRRWTAGSPEECFLGGFLVAVSSWAAWEIVIILFARVKAAAQARGWIGVKQEILGGAAVVATMTPAPPLKTEEKIS